MTEETKFYLYTEKKLYPKQEIENDYGIFSIERAFVWKKEQSKFVPFRINILKGYFKNLKEKKYYVATGTLEQDTYRNGYVLFAYQCCEIQHADTPIVEIPKAEDVCLPKIVGNKMWKGHKTDERRAQEDFEKGVADRQKLLHREYNDLKRQARAEVYAELGIKTYRDMRQVLEGWVQERYEQKLKEARENSKTTASKSTR